MSIPIVHSSYGRVRVHLPDPTDKICRSLRTLAGVQSAQANELTGNILIRFNPQQKNVQALLAELASAGTGTSVIEVQAAPPPRVIDVIEPIHLRPEPPVVIVTGLRGRIYKMCGWASIGLAVVGVIVPGIPAVPFVVLAGYFFMRSSPEAHAWLLRSRWFGAVLREWEEQHAVRKSVRNMALGLMGAGLIITLLLGLPPALVITIVALEIVGLGVVLSLPVLEEPRHEIRPA